MKPVRSEPHWFAAMKLKPVHVVADSRPNHVVVDRKRRERVFIQ